MTHTTRVLIVIVLVLISLITYASRTITVESSRLPTPVNENFDFDVSGPVEYDEPLPEGLGESYLYPVPYRGFRFDWK